MAPFELVYSKEGYILEESRASIKLTMISFDFTKWIACFYLMWYHELYGDLIYSLSSYGTEGKNVRGRRLNELEEF